MLITNVQKLSVLACFAAATLVAGDTKDEQAMIAVQSGTASFVANTNVPAVSIKGKSTALAAKVNLHRLGDGMELEHIDANLPVKTLVTGMGVRDEHMRKYIFTTADGQEPDLHFEGEKSTCSGSAKDISCQVAGTLTIRGVARPFTLPLKVREEGAGFKAVGDGVVKLSAYGIEQPTQLGVKTEDDVQVHFDFNAKQVQVSGALAMLGRGR